ncbi:Putative Fungal specific transcription factor domain protein [Aspergillus calidoustus]|uniref:Putative Fungal specific transcription factor domain protein n=1 Tax=Aspergillus calidoustus TaxID=454130 RepID=A0A0U5GPQ1_ASPCI|nr:Putative Fungal specific transcription factor domain protein [Aspergillus calidoustus]
MTSPRSHQPSMSFSPSVPGPGPHDSTTAGGASRAVSDLPQAQVDAIIRAKRKAREPKACYPCHARKVKCDRNLPCDGCVKRDHAELCSYERPSKRRTTADTGASAYTDGVGAEVGPGPGHGFGLGPSGGTPFGGTGAGVSLGDGVGFGDGHVRLKQEPGMSNQASPAMSGGRISIAREDWDNTRTRLKEMEQMLATLRAGLDKANEEGQTSTLETGSVQSGDASTRSKGASPEREGIHAPNTLGEGTVHLGSRSVLAYILNNKSGSDQLQTLLEGGILPKLGLDNESATYPFVDLWSSDMSTFDISAVCYALPTDQQCKEFFCYYRDIAGAIYPVIEDVVQFEKDLDLMLHNRTATGGVYRADNDQAQRPFGISIAYLGLLFAVLASGCQSSDLPGKERELTSQVYVCCSYQCLRMTNFLSQPTIEAIQTLLVIGNVLSYNMNPGISYVLLGMTLRMGLALGLHVESSHFSSAERYRRRHVWWSMAWQDSHFSLSYDRPSTTAVCQPEIAYREDSKTGERSYFETLCQVINLALEVVRSRMLSPHSQMSWRTIQDFKERIQRTMIQAAPYLRDQNYCTTATEHLERAVLKLHSSYFLSELCRPALKSTADTHDPATARMRSDCLENLMMTVEAYIDMHTVSSHASRSWIALQRAISSIFLLAVTDECKSNTHFWTLLRKLKAIVYERANAEFDYGGTAAADPSTAPPASTDPTNRSPSFSTLLGTPLNSTISPAAATAATTTAGGSLSSPAAAAAAADTQTQWAKPLTKTLRALEKLEAAFHTRPSPSLLSTGASPSYLNPASAAYANTGGNAFPPMTGAGASAPASAMTPGVSSLPPPTPESSTSGEWSIPNILDRAQEYIHPPLWS